MFTRRGILILALCALTASCTSYVPQGATSPAQLSVDRIIAIINETRTANGRKPLAYNAKLAAAASRQAHLMASRDTLSHDLGETLRERTNAAGYVGAVGENVAGGQKTLEAAIAGWMNSAAHRNALLSPKFSEFGLAVERVPAGTTSRYGIYWSIVFGGDSNLWLQ